MSDEPSLFFEDPNAARALRSVIAGLQLLRRTATVIPYQMDEPRLIQVMRNPKSPGWTLPGGGVDLGETDIAGAYREWGEELPVSCDYRTGGLERFHTFHLCADVLHPATKPFAAFVRGAVTPPWLLSLVGEVPLEIKYGVDEVFAAPMRADTPVGVAESDEATDTAWLDVYETPREAFGYYHADVAFAWREYLRSGRTRLPDPGIRYRVTGGAIGE